MKDSTRQDYGERIARVAGHIAEHPDGDHDLEHLAGLACFSPWHFHRIYRTMMGETVADTVRRVRLHRAAGALVRSQTPIAEIARHAGYGSAEAFTRAFVASHGVTPGAYRVRGLLHPLANIEVPHQAGALYDVTFRTLTPIPVVALRHVGPYMEIGQAFERLYAWGVSRGLIGPHTRSLGVYYDDPRSVGAERCRSDACLSLPRHVEIDDDLRHIQIAGGRYATIRHKGPYAELENAYDWLYGTWLPQSGAEPADLPVVEKYLNNPRECPPSEWLTAISLPVKEEAPT